MQSISESFIEFAQLNIEDVFRRIFAALTLDVVYGMSVSGPEDQFILRIELANELFGKMKLPGAFLADMIPMLQYIPAWCPGGAAQRFSQKYRPFFNRLNSEPFDIVKADMVRTLLLQAQVR